MKNYRFILKDLDCASCAKKIETHIASYNEYKDVIVNFSTSTLSFKTDKKINVEEDIQRIIQSVEPDTTIISNSEKKVEEVQRSYIDIFRIIIGVFIYMLGMLLHFKGLLMNILTVISIITLLAKTAQKAYKQIKNKILDENFLIVISVIGACLLGETMEGVMVITLYEIGKILESKAIGKTRKSISNLINIKPEYANLKVDEDFNKVSPKEVKVGDIIIVKVGEKIPLDGEIVNGTAKIDNSALTGESRLIQVTKGDKVLSGGINTEGLIEIKVEKLYEDGTVSQILNLVENATDKKAKTENTVSKIAKIYTPIVICLAIIVAVFMPIVFSNVSYNESIYKALTFLVISCPCSIAISVPLSYFSGIGKASKSGILVKGSNYLDGFKDIKTIIFDKTGTITTGNFVVSNINIYNNNYSEESILEYLVKGESFSNHPIAKSILNKWGKEINNDNVTDFKEVPGKGIEYNLDEKKIKIGNYNFAGDKKILEDNIGTNLYLNINGETIGSITIIDEVKPDAKKTIKNLNKIGIKTFMFTGDSKDIAIEVAKQVGINNVNYEMLPQDKYAKLEEIINKSSKKIAYVGDGINDSPVLARADIGISMGGVGSSSAIEASDVVFMTDELNKILESIEISKKTNKIIKQNLIFALGVKILILLFSIFGFANMWQAVFADVGTTIITVLNTIRILT